MVSSLILSSPTIQIWYRGSFSRLVGGSRASWIEGLCTSYLTDHDEKTLNNALTQVEEILDEAQCEEAQLLENLDMPREWRVAQGQTQSIRAVIQALSEVVCAVMMGFDEMLQMHSDGDFQYQSW